MAYYIPTVRKSGGTRPPCPPPNCARAVEANFAILGCSWDARGGSTTWTIFVALGSFSLHKPLPAH